MSDSNPPHWSAIIERYAVGHRSDMDMSVGVSRLIDELRRMLPQAETGYSVSANFLRAPMQYIYVCNKTTGPLNIPRERNRFNALTECELTFYQNYDNTLRFRYFIQETHGHLIHGLSWVKASPDIAFCDADFKPVLELAAGKLLCPAIPAEPKMYGILNGSRQRVGCMHNFKVAGFEDGGVMNDMSFGKMLSLIYQAYTYFTRNQSTIINLINNQSKQQ